MLVRWATAAGLLLMAASSAVPQDLAPEVLLLSRIKRHLREELAHVPNYTCLQTISRYRGSRKSGASPARLDTIQLEIVYTDGREWYGSPGAAQLSVDNPVAFISGGMIGTGAFAMAMNNMVEGGIFTYRGEDTVTGRRAVRYDYRIPGLLKPLQITMYGASGTVGEEGSIWVDPESLDLIRVEAHATEIPPYLPLEETSMTVEYARMRIADADTLLAQAADSQMTDDSGIENYNRTEFTHCHSYSTSSTIAFDSKPAPPAESTPPAPALGTAVPPFLEVTIVLAAPVSDRNSVGSLIEGKISGNVIRKGKVVVPDGSVVHGRLRAVDHYTDLGAFAVGIEFMDVDVRGESMPFYADFLRADKDPRIDTDFSRFVFVHAKNGPRIVNRVTSQPDLPGVAQFFVKGNSFTLPAGFRLFWRTRGLLN